MNDTNWGTQAKGWARYWGDLADPAREAIADDIDISHGDRLLDVGCGTGEFCILAASHGAVVSGIDSGRGMVEVARNRIPEADLRVGDAVDLPWDAESFDTVTAFNALQFADGFAVALSEVRRVMTPNGTAVVCNWGRTEECDLKPVFDALDGGNPSQLKEDRPQVGEAGVLEELLRESGLNPVRTVEVDVPFEVSDLDTLREALMVDAGLHGIHDGAEEVVEVAIRLAESNQRQDGSYRFENRFRYVVATLT